MGSLAMVADVVEILHTRAPHWPAATVFLMEHLGNRSRMAITLPNLGGARPGVALAPPLLAFSREQEQFAVGRQVAVAAVVVEEQLFRLAFLAIEIEEAFAVRAAMLEGRREQHSAVARRVLGVA